MDHGVKQNITTIKMCLYPKLVKNRKYTVNKKNGGNVPVLHDKRKEFVPVGCGKCIECRKRKANDWKIRLHEDLKVNKNAWFVTLTFNDKELVELENDVLELGDIKGYELDNEVAKKAVRRFCERWRKKNKKSIRHWLVTELGQKNTERIHLHGILWTNKPEEIKEKWKYGDIYIGEYCNNETIGYIVKYLYKSDKKHKEYTPKMFVSAGIGKNYLESYNGKNHDKNSDYYLTNKGHKMALPLYYRNNIYNEETRDDLWSEKLDENKRYILGNEVDVSKGYEKYYKLLSEGQDLNKSLGYGDDKKNWNRIKYENSLRELKALERWKKINNNN